MAQPISLSTGAVDVTVPLFNLDATGMTIPFSLRYHTSGIKVEDQAGNIGLGWTLFPGFRITRTIMGNPDDLATTEKISGYLSEDFTQELHDMAIDNPWWNGGGISHPTHDAQYDIFTIHLPNLNTTFIITWENGVMKGTPIPDAPVKITPIGGGGRNKSPMCFVVSDDKGYSYIFGRTYRDNIKDVGTTEWMLEQMNAPGSDNAIYFSYDPITIPNEFPYTYSVVVQDRVESGCSGGSDQVHLPEWSPNTYVRRYDEGWSWPPAEDRSSWALTKMTFLTGMVNMAYTNSSKTKLASINVYNEDNRLIKNVLFSGGDLLNSVSISGEGQYTFEYDMQPFTYKNGQDYAGFYNGQNNQNLVPRIQLKHYTAKYLGTQTHTGVMNIGYANREPNAAYMQSHILKKINYPTGGYTNYTYEPHRFLSKGNETFGLGLRVTKVETFDRSSGKVMTKTYKYGWNESGVGNLGIFKEVLVNNVDVLPATLDGNDFITTNIIDITPGPYEFCGCQHFRQRRLSSYHKYKHFSFNLPVWYPCVTEYSNESKAEYFYDYTPSQFYNRPIADEDNHVLAYIRNLGSKGPKLIYKRVFSNTENVWDEHEYTYSTNTREHYSWIIEPVHLTYYWGQMQPHDKLWRSPSDISNRCFTNKINPYEMHLLHYVVDNEQLLTESHIYDRDGNYYSTAMRYDYDPNYPYNMTQKISAGSGTAITERFYYPVGNTVPDAAVLTADQRSMISGLANAGYFTTIVEKETFKMSTLVSAELYGFRDWSNRVIAPEQVYIKTGTKPFEARMHYYNYDIKGNVFSVSKENDVKSSYIWGYRSQHPIARAVNAETKDIYHTSFEGVDGNSGDSKTGKQSYTGLFSKSLKNLTNGKYILTWWEKTGDKWNLQVTTNIVVANGEYTINLQGQIDEVRFYPANAQMSTYTYEPMVGITSECDISNRVIRYEYDSYGRLVYIRDQDNNILKSFNYQFNQQVY
ncbi:YD repeat-containing protein [Chitinophagaceae bacterium OAS944]|uniref:hypothetical protein n=1 Tax=Niastella sp. OAS944 TaxID=2664089 RepID=UPI0035C827FF|nr:YD repeat-containing protein [Chitinophagaceae bacterium OAS944]